jgi:hypothetical protein
LSPLWNAFCIPFNFVNCSFSLQHSKQYILYTSHIDCLLAGVAPSAYICLINIGSDLKLHFYFVRHYCEHIKGGILFHHLFLKVFAMLVVIKPIIRLALCEYTTSMRNQACTNLIITRLFSINIINFLYGWLNILFYNLIILFRRTIH